MEHKAFRILGLAGSLRRASFHCGIVRAAHEVAPEWMGCESFDLARIPYFNQNVEDEGIPEPVKELREKIRAYDAVLIATPEYDYAIPDPERRTMEQCTHSDQIRDVQPSAQGCEECLEIGNTWVHLRECLVCGHVGCCDSSKNKHATRHFLDTSHPIVASLEPGEDWRWCYVDETLV